MNLPLKKSSYFLFLCFLPFLMTLDFSAYAQSSSTLNIPNLIGYYEFEKGFENSFSSKALKDVPISSSVSFDKGLLYVNGDYSNYKSDFATSYDPTVTTFSDDFTLSWTFKPHELKDKFDIQSILCIDQYSRIMNFAINRKGGFFVIALKNGEYYQEYEEAKIELDKWYNITAVIKAKEKTAEVYLNGYQFPKISLADGLNEVNSKYIFNFSFCSYGNGNVFNGWVDKLIVIKRAITPQEFQTIYPLMIKDVPEMLPDAVEKTVSAQSGKFSYVIDENWTYLPSCVEGDKAKKVLVTCPNKRKVEFRISHKETENKYVILRNSHSSIGGYEFGDYDACLSKILELGNKDCDK